VGLKRIQQLRLPRPLSIEVVADDDQAIAKYQEAEFVDAGNGRRIGFRTDAHLLRVRGSHISFKFPRRPNDVIVSALAALIKPCLERRENWLARETTLRVHRIDESMGITSLIGSPGPVSRGGAAGSQSHVLQELIGVAKAERQSPRTLVLTGDAGVGKSVSLRALAQIISAEYIGREYVQTCPLCIFLPLQQMDIRDLAEGPPGSVSPFELWRFLCLHWSNFVNENFRIEAERWSSVRSQEYKGSSGPATPPQIPLVDEEWINDQLAAKNVMLVLDGVDEFLANNPMVTLDMIVELARYFERRFESNHRLFVVFGIRSTWPSYEALVRHRTEDVYRVSRLTLVDAEKLFPGISAWVGQINDEGLVATILTPLILMRIGPRLHEFDAAQLRTKSMVMDVSLNALLESSVLAFGNPSGLTCWKQSLCVIAWLFYSKSRGELSLEELMAEASELRDRWLSVSKSGSSEASNLVSAISLLTENRTAIRLLNRSVLFPTYGTSYRFQHREWQDYLVSSYLATCIRLGQYHDLSQTAFQASMFAMAGEQIFDHPITGRQITTLLSVGGTIERQFAFGNVCGTLFNSTAPMDGPAVRLVIESALQMPVPRHLLISGFAYRALRCDPRDFAVPTIRGELIGTLHHLVENGLYFS